MTSINSDEIIFRPDTVLDPEFYVPPGLARVTNSIPTLLEEIENGGDDLGGVGDVPDGSLDPDTLPAPATAVVISQTARLLASGAYVIDVVFEVEDVPGATSAEVRVQ